MSASQLLTEVLDTAQQIGAHVDVLLAVEAQSLRDQLVDRFATGKGGRAMWEHMANASSIQDPEAWRWIGSFLGSPPAVLLFDLAEEPLLLRFEHGSQIVALLASTTGFEFYVTDEQASYLLAFNHHDFLLGDGSAKAWILSLNPTRGNEC